MAKQTTRKFKSFNLDDAPVIAENERILENATKTAPVSAAPTEPETSAPQVQEEAAPQAAVQQVQPEQPVVTTSLVTSKSKKTSNGIVVDVPMQDYIELSRLKIETGHTLKELALIAIHEFIERNKQIG